MLHLRAGTYVINSLTQNGNFHVPTAAERAGDFSGLVDAAGRPIIVYDPLTTDPVTGARQPFPGNRIPSNRILICLIP